MLQWAQAPPRTTRKKKDPLRGFFFLCAFGAPFFFLAPSARASGPLPDEVSSTNWEKFQSVVLPDGMVAQMFGPVEGRRHDVFLLNKSRLDQRMTLLPPTAYVYGDQAYPVRAWLLSPFKGPNKPILQSAESICHRSFMIKTVLGVHCINQHP